MQRTKKGQSEASQYSNAFEIKKFVKDTDGTINTEEKE